MLRADIFKIRRYNSILTEGLQRECQIENYDNQWDNLEVFRKAMYCYVEQDKFTGTLKSKITILDNGHVIDHHALGYFAPMSFYRIGFGEKNNTHAEQINILREFLASHDVRLIYVPLPCKIAVHPNIAVAEDVLPSDKMVIPQWRSTLLELSKMGVEIVDCYEDLKADNTYTKNHHISPVGAEIIAQKVFEYVKDTTDIKNYDNNIKSKREWIGSSVLFNSGNNNSIELGTECFYTERYFHIFNDDYYIPYMGRNVESEIAVIGDCNLQSYRGSGSDVTAQLSGKLKYPVKYIGRYLPFAKNDSINKLPTGSLHNISVLIYVGFVSGSYVRACGEHDMWCTQLPDERIFENEL